MVARILLALLLFAALPQPPRELTEAWRIMVAKPPPGLTYGARR